MAPDAATELCFLVCRCSATFLLIAILTSHIISFSILDAGYWGMPNCWRLQLLSKSAIPCDGGDGNMGWHGDC